MKKNGVLSFAIVTLGGLLILGMPLVATAGEGTANALQDLEEINAPPMGETGAYHVSPVYEELVKVTLIKRGGPRAPGYPKDLEGWNFDKRTGRLTVKETVDNRKEMVIVHGKLKVPWAWQMPEAIANVRVSIDKEEAVRGKDFEVDEGAGIVRFLKEELCHSSIHYYITYDYRDEPSKCGGICKD